jgi:hypothetical protein
MLLLEERLNAKSPRHDRRSYAYELQQVVTDLEPSRVPARSRNFLCRPIADVPDAQPGVGV